MSAKSEQLLETLLDLERSRQRERDLRIESETLLEGLRSITDAQDTETLFLALVKVLHSVIDFKDAFILQAQNSQEIVSIASTSEKIRSTTWQCLSVFNRVLAGQPVATFDVDQIPEWAQQPPTVREDVKSALHIGLTGSQRAAILVVTHPNPRHFGTAQIKQAKRFAPLASQALLTLDLQRAITQRDRFFQLSMDLMGIVSFDGHFKQFNTVWGDILGYSDDALSKKSLLDFIHPDDRRNFIETLDQLKNTGAQLFIECRFQCRTKGYRWLSCSLADYSDERLCYIVARDVTDRVMAEQKLAHDACHDPLTGLYNRAEFMKRLNYALAYAARQPRYGFALLYLDLDRFKIINDTLGHNIGDELLREVSRHLLNAVRKVDIVARLGGDEFVILLMDITIPEEAERVAQNIHSLLTPPVILQSNAIKISASIGIALSTIKYQDAAAMLHDADTAMYAAKSNGKSQYVLFYPGVHG
ncbi:MAG: sensor domain-containing diguanylate cyclase [Candidatus Competibacter sp.]